jgi:hypothetical protein
MAYVSAKWRYRNFCDHAVTVGVQMVDQTGVSRGSRMCHVAANTIVADTLAVYLDDRVGELTPQFCIYEASCGVAQRTPESRAIDKIIEALAHEDLIGGYSDG